jgi:hypothetical protein
MPDYKLAAQFIASKVGATGLTVTVDIYRLGTVGAVASDQSATELGGGVYVYTHTDATAGDYFGNFKTADTTVDAQQIGSWAALEVPRIDAAISSRSSHSAADVWTSTTRTLTQTAAQVAAAVSGSSLALTNQVSFAATLTGLTIPATWESIYLTVKRTTRDADADAILQILKSEPADPGDGVTRYAGAAPGAGVAALASLTVNQAGGTVAIVIQDNLDFASYVGSNSYDVKCLLADGTSVLLSSSSLFTIALTETRTV